MEVLSNDNISDYKVKKVIEIQNWGSQKDKLIVFEKFRPNSTLYIWFI